jgi:hypothetical protein
MSWAPPGASIRAGFQLDRQEPHHSFGHDVIGEYWSREL